MTVSAPVPAPDRTRRERTRGCRGASPAGLLAAVLLAASGLLAPAAAHAAAFLEVATIEGESSDPAHLRWIDLTSFHLPATAPVSTPARIPASAQLIVHKTADKASALLAEAAGNGKRLDKAQLEFTRVSGTTAESIVFYRIELIGVRVTAFTHLTMGDSVPVEVVTLSFESARWIYTQFSATSGQASAKHEATWDLLRGTATTKSTSLTFTVSSVTQPDGRLGIQWSPTPGRPYVLLQAQDPAGPYTPILKIEPVSQPGSRWAELPRGLPFAFFRLEESQ